jgi:hypothetical protein
MAGLEFWGYLVTGLYLYQVLGLFYLYGKAVFLQIIAPFATAASGGGLVNGNYFISSRTVCLLVVVRSAARGQQIQAEEGQD